MNEHRLSHIGICVSDLERSVHFYRDLLGFQEVSRLEIEGPVTERLLDISGGSLQAVYLKMGGTVIELLYYPVAGHEPAETPRAMNKLGLTHISINVADLDVAVTAVEQGGGQQLNHTLIDTGGSKAMFVTDPDGMRIELVQAMFNPDAQQRS